MQFRLVCLSCALIVGSLQAGPPSATYFFPAGAQQGKSVEVAVGGGFSHWPVKVWASHPGIKVEASKQKERLSISVDAATPPGLYQIRLFDEEGATELRPFQVGTLPDVAEVEPNDEITQAQVITASCVVNGRLQKRADVDVFAFTLQEGQTLVASLEAHEGLHSFMDGTLQILNADGFVLEQNNDYHGIDPQITFTAKKAGKYLIRLFAFPGAADSSIHFAGGDNYVFRLTLTTAGFADVPWPLAVQASQKSEATLAGWNLPSDLIRLPVEPLSNGHETTLWHSKLGNSISLKRPPYPCFDSRKFDPKGLVAPFAFTGRLDQPDTPLTLELTGKKGVPLKLRVDSRAIGSPIEPVVRVLDTAGKVVVQGEPSEINKECLLNYTPATDGPVRLQIADFNGRGGSRFTFLLSVETPKPDFAFTVAADRFTATVGKPLELPVTIQRLDGFAEPIELRVEGLPAGILAMHQPPAKDDGKPQMIRLTADKAFSGPIRIVGIPKNAPKSQKPARALLPEGAAADLWLTVLPDKAPKK